MDEETVKRPAVPSRPPTTPPRDPIPYRQIFGGTGVLLVAMLLILLFPRLVHINGGASTSGSTATQVHPTPAAPTATATPPIAEVAWASALTRHSLVLNDGTTFTPTDIAPDGSLLVGYAVGQTDAPYYIDAVTLPSFTPQRLFTLPADATKPIVKTDGTYAAWIGGDAATGTTVHQTIGYINLATGRYAELYDAFALLYDPRFFDVADGQFIYSPVKSPGTLDVLDMATGNSGPLPIHTPSGTTLTTLAVAWPRLVYAASDQSVHLYDNQTQVDTPLSNITFATNTDMLALSGTTLYWAHPTSGNALALTAFDLTTTAQATGQTVTTIAATQLTALSVGTHVVAWDDGHTRTAYDLTKQQTVILGPTLAEVPTQIAQRGTMLWYRSNNGSQPIITLVNLAKL
jgi:hypothetical protein